tara:strand:+ start:542 stop:715 length:174 start_codon:yes stop_codon:yes gene_type:complete
MALSLSELEFNPAVAEIGNFIIAGINWLKLAKSGGGEIGWRYALTNQEFYYRNGTRC